MHAWSLCLPQSAIWVLKTCWQWGKGLCPASLLHEENRQTVNLFSGSPQPHSSWSCQVASSEEAGPQLVQVSIIFLQPYVLSLIPSSPLCFCSSTCSDCSCPEQPQAAVSSLIDIKQDQIPVTSNLPMSLCLSCLLCFLWFILWTVFGGCACHWLEQTGWFRKLQHKRMPML